MIFHRRKRQSGCMTLIYLSMLFGIIFFLGWLWVIMTALGSGE